MLSHDEIRARFDSDVPVQWIHTFTGIWQNLHPVTLQLGHDGSTYHGMIHLESGDLTFDIYGSVADGKTTLQEIDATGRTSGYIIADIQDGRLSGQWWSVDFSRSATLALRSDAVIELRRFEPEVLLLNGRMGNQGIDLVVQREESDLLSGFCSLSNDETYHRLTGKCADRTCDKMRFLMHSSDSGGFVTCDLQRGNVYNLRITSPDGEIQEGSVTLEKKYPMRRLLFGNYVGNVDCPVPTLSMPSFDTWLTSKIESWYTNACDYVDSIQNGVDTPGPDMRWSVQASAWIDLTLVTPEHVSGIMTLYNPYKLTYDRSAFIFDVKSGKEVSIKDLGRKSHFGIELVDDAMHKKEPHNEDPGYLAWYQEAKFEHIALSPGGFVLFTNFDALQGDLHVKLNYSDYTGDLKRNTFVLELLK